MKYSNFKNNLDSCLESVVKNNEEIVITTKRGNAVVVSEERYHSLLETLYLSSQKGLVDKIKEGEKEDISEMSEYSSNNINL